MEVIKVVFAILMIQNGSVIEYVPTQGMTDCLKQKRVITRNIGKNQEGMVMQCKEVKAELYEDMGYKSQVVKNKKKDLEKHRQSSQEKLAEYWRLI